MKKKLIKIKQELYHFKDDVRIEGKNELMRGDCSGLSGNCSGLEGNLDECEISDEDREKGVNINDLIGD